MKIAAALLLGFLIGAACRWTDIPVPAPPKLIGALLVVSITVGYLAADALLARRTAAPPPPAREARVGEPEI